MFGRLKTDGADSKSIDGMRGTHSSDDGEVLDAQALPWKSTAKPTGVQGEAASAQAEMQQKKIINFFMADKKVQVTPEEIVNLDARRLRELKRKRLDVLQRAALTDNNPEVSESERAEFLRQLKQGDITEANEVDFLMLIRDPINTEKIGAERMFERIASDQRQTQILAVAADYNLRNWKLVNAEALEKLLGDAQEPGEDYRTPVGFAQFREHFLEEIRPKASEQMYKAYLHSMDELERVLYGKRYEYYVQFEALRQEALGETKSEVEAKTTKRIRGRRGSKERLAGEREIEALSSEELKTDTHTQDEEAQSINVVQKKRKTVKADSRAAEIQSAKTLESSLQEVRQSDLELQEANSRKIVPKRRQAAKYIILSSERSAEMLGRAVIDGDPWRSGLREQLLSTHNLAEAGLGPAYEVAVGGVNLWLSELFSLANGRVVALGYVTDGASYKVRSYYRSSERGLWLYLPDYTRRSDGGVDGYGIGYGRESVTLPAELQEALAQIEQQRGARSPAGAGCNPEFVFAGTAHSYESSQEFQMMWQHRRLKGDYYREVSVEPINHDFNLHTTAQKKAPYTLAIDYNRAPDFTQRLVQFVTTTVDAGAVQVDGFVSHDGQYIWLFMQDGKGRAWVSNVEAVSPVTSLGLRRDWTLMGDFTTPLYEFTTQAGIYGDRGDTRGARQGMWKNYLSNIPLLQEYLKVA